MGVYTILYSSVFSLGTWKKSNTEIDNNFNINTNQTVNKQSHSHKSQKT